jgi:hypothetical protein
MLTGSVVVVSDVGVSLLQVARENRLLLLQLHDVFVDAAEDEILGVPE